ncbi:MAG: DUF4097 family beta strand repeat protein [Saprospirales bacterium]|nr:DUF4097 family beta strand repeat protein [Saprospirales bacterium]MBK8492159.1 DUF4097 family beta strand repeat protein [Saprospirales bacterium]
MKLHIPTFLVFPFLIGALASGAQTPLQVVTKTIEQTLPYQLGYEVNIEGEKAEIIVETWENNSVQVILELVAKHPDRKIAERDIAAMKYSIDQHGKMIYFRNYISPDIGQPKPESQIKAIYTIHLPENCPVYLKNYFGNATISHLNNLLRLQSEFGKIFLEDLSGDLFIQTRFGDVFGERISGNLQIDARRSDITLREVSGTCDIKSTYGVIKLFSDDSLLKLNIEAEKSDVYFFDPHPTAYGYALTAHYGSITVPTDLKMNFLENTSSMKRATFTPARERASISVKISFGDIVIRNP